MKKLSVALGLLIGLVIAGTAAAQQVSVSIRNGTSSPALCQPTSLNIFVNRTSSALQLCTAANTWTSLLSTTGTAAAANALKSATTTVNVSSATAPTAGQVLTATSGTAATWQTPAASSAPFSDATALVKNAADATKLVKIDATGVTTGTTLTLLGRPTGLGVGTPTTAEPLADTMLSASATTQYPLVIQGKAGQTANLLRFQNSAGTYLGAFDSAGRLDPAGLYIYNNLPLVDGGLVQYGALSTSGIVVKNGAYFAWSTDGTTSTVNSSLTRQADNVVGVGSAGGGWLVDARTSRVTTQFDATSTTTLANVPGLSVSVIAGRTYSFDATLYTTSNVAGGVKAAIAGTATATAVIYEGYNINGTTLNAQTRQTTLGNAVAATTAVTAAFIKIFGTITVNATGTLTVQFAQNTSNGAASSVLVGSTFIVTPH